MAGNPLQTKGQNESNLDDHAQQTTALSDDHAHPSAHHAPAPGQVVAAEEDEALGDVSDITSTSSLRSSVFNYPIEHGRQYHAYKDGKYHRPNDETELDRLDMMHELFSIVNDGKLHQASIGETPQRMLDVGAGSGIWCNEMGDRYPSAEIIGVDISANMPTYTAPNVRFEVDDVEEDWTYQQPFDYIHSRYMAGSIKDWAGYVRQCFEHTRPGGGVEFVDFDYWIYSQDGSLRDDDALRRWDALTFDGAQRTGRMLNPGPRLEQWAREAGFVDIRVIRQPLPIGLWPRDKKMVSHQKEKRKSC
jgi:SAM-dependent methyltransferase